LEEISEKNDIFYDQREVTLQQKNTWSDNKVRELIAVEVLHNSLLNVTVFAFRVLTLEATRQYQTLVSHSKQFRN
jgi:hypothetical protein